MPSLNVSVFGSATVAVPASGKVAAYSAAPFNVYQVVGYPNSPDSKKLLTSVAANTEYVSSSFSAAATVIIEAGAAPVFYEVGASARVKSILDAQYQSAPVALDATGTLTVAAILGGLVTSSTAAAVTATLDTGTVMDAGSTFAIGDSFNWSAINTGPNTFTVTASTAHTIVGAGAVATGTAGNFRTRKSAAGTFVTYRIA